MMDLAGKCQGAFHCGSLSAWNSHDTLFVIVVLCVIFFLAWVVNGR